MNRFLAASMAALVAMSPLAAHANDWKSIPYPYVFRDGENVTPEMITALRGPILDHCLLVSYETIPHKDRVALDRAFSAGLAGGAGNAAGYAGEVVAVGAKMVARNVAGVGILGFLGNIFFGVREGVYITNDRFRNNTQACIARAGLGQYTMAPSEADQIVDENKPHKVNVGLSVKWGLADHRQSNDPANP